MSALNEKELDEAFYYIRVGGDAQHTKEKIIRAELAQLRAELENLKEQAEVYKGAKEIIDELRDMLAGRDKTIEEAKVIMESAEIIIDYLNSRGTYGKIIGYSQWIKDKSMWLKSAHPAPPSSSESEEK